MAYVFISYKTQERQSALHMRGALSLALRCDVWWDQDLQTGGTWRPELDVALNDAACVVVLWSKESARSPWVQHEAAVAKSLGKLVPARIDDCEIPAPYQTLQTADLSGWTGQEDHPEFVKLSRGVRAVIRASRNWRVKAMIVASLLCAFVAGIFIRSVVSPPPECKPVLIQEPKPELKPAPAPSESRPADSTSSGPSTVPFEAADSTDTNTNLNDSNTKPISPPIDKMTFRCIKDSTSDATEEKNKIGTTPALRLQKCENTANVQKKESKTNVAQIWWTVSETSIECTCRAEKARRTR